VSPKPVEGSGGRYKVRVSTWRLGEIIIPVKFKVVNNKLVVSVECPVEEGYHEAVSSALHACSSALFLLAIHINDIENSAFIITGGKSYYIGEALV